MNPVGLSPSGTLTLAIDETGLTNDLISIAAYDIGGTAVTQLGTGECPAYDVGPGGYVAISTTVSDTQGHLCEYEIQTQYGNNNTVTVADPGLRGYQTNPLTAAAPAGVCNHGDPDYTCKGWVGGNDIAYFPCEKGGVNWTSPFSMTNLPPDCCYEFRIYYSKRVTDGVNFPSLGEGSFQTISLKFSS
jgi:hypothetical protein